MQSERSMALSAMAMVECDLVIRLFCSGSLSGFCKGGEDRS